MLKSFHHFSIMCQGRSFPPSQPSLHVRLKISEFLADVTPTQLLSWEQPASLSLSKRSDALNSDTGREQKATRFTRKNSLLLNYPHPSLLCDTVQEKTN